MTGFLLRKTGAALLVVFVASVIVFAAVRAVPGDPATVMSGDDPTLIPYYRHLYGLDRPLPVQYVKWLSQTLQGNLGRTHSGIPVTTDDRAADPAHARARDAEPAPGHPDRRARGGDRRGPARQSRRLRDDRRRGAGALGAALLARPAADHLLRRRPALAPVRELCVDEPPGREPAAHGAAGDRARHRLRGGPDAADALVDDRLARRRLRAHRALEGAVRVAGRRPPRAAQQPDHRRDAHRARLRRAPLGRGDHGVSVLPARASDGSASTRSSRATTR